MIKSFNKSVARASADFVVMVTDDDPVDPFFLAEMFTLYKENPQASVYCGFERGNKLKGGVEWIKGEHFVREILDPKKTTNLLWSSAVLRKADALEIGLIPDYGSPHLADHALIALVGSKNGGVVKNKMFSSLTSHENNFSKFNFDAYLAGCKGFFRLINESQLPNVNNRRSIRAVRSHLKTWLITNVFSLMKYYTLKKEPSKVAEIERFATNLLELPFLQSARFRFFLKKQIFKCKVAFNILK